jgi:hypothetical protein
MTLGHAIDVLALITAVMAAIFWVQASRNTLRRISRTEAIDAADFNRMIVAINRSQQLNARAALMTAASTLLMSMRYAMNLWPGIGS